MQGRGGDAAHAGLGDRVAKAVQMEACRAMEGMPRSDAVD
jgi:hypothetical protein